MNAVLDEFAKRVCIPWTDAELWILRRDYPYGGIGACIKQLPNRSAKSIAQRAHVEGLRNLKRRLPGEKSNRALIIEEKQFEAKTPPDELINPALALRLEIRRCEIAHRETGQALARASRAYALYIKEHNRDVAHERRVS